MGVFVCSFVSVRAFPSFLYIENSTIQRMGSLRENEREERKEIRPQNRLASPPHAKLPKKL